MKNFKFFTVLLAIAMFFGSISFADASPPGDQSEQVLAMVQTDAETPAVSPINEYTQVVYSDIVATGPVKAETEKGRKVKAERHDRYLVAIPPIIEDWKPDIVTPPNQTRTAVTSNRAREKV